MGDDLSLHEAIFTTRSMRRLKPDPVPPADLARALCPRQHRRGR